MNGQQYTEQLIQRWGESRDGRSLEAWLCAEVAKMHEDIEYWSYCTSRGMHDLCPEKRGEFTRMMTRYGIAPYAAEQKQ